MTILQPAEWQLRAENHRARLAPFIEAQLARRGRGETHPVWDFLFDYYSFKPSHLLKWSPGWGVELRGDFGGFKELSPTPNGVALDLEKFSIHRVNGLRDTLQILEQTANRPAFYGCNGLHEWAMVYRQSEHRHAAPLRLSGDEIADLVESQPIRCSHYDAFRFFTSAARGLNVLNPQHDTRAQFEQPGCIHASMDLLKWSSKFYPWIASELIADAWEIAIQAREIDMRAAPYDLSAFDVAPIRIETALGRREYGELQRRVTEKAHPIRMGLVESYRGLLDAIMVSLERAAGR